MELSTVTAVYYAQHDLIVTRHWSYGPYGAVCKKKKKREVVLAVTRIFCAYAIISRVFYQRSCLSVTLVRWR